MRGLPICGAIRMFPCFASCSERMPAPLVIESDRAGYALGEHWLGASHGLDDVVFVAVGTGIGAGILSGGRLIRGIGGAGGAVGWMALSPQFEDLYAVIGCWEAEAAGPAVARRAGHVSARSVVSAARLGEVSSCLALQKAAMYIGMGVANLDQHIQPANGGAWRRPDAGGRIAPRANSLRSIEMGKSARSHTVANRTLAIGRAGRPAGRRQISA